MELFIIDAFAERLFTGNPAAVCPLPEWLPDELMQQIAFENNLAETAFMVREGEGYRIRWFTPAVEVDLCGHATLAAAHALFHHLGFTGAELHFSSRSGVLTVTRNGDMLTLNFPADEQREVAMTPELLHCFSEKPTAIYKGKTDYMFVLDDEETVDGIIPHLPAIRALDARGVIITAPGKEVDFVSRFFAPQSGIDEDPVTGSAHTSLAPYWADKLHKNRLSAAQRSPRGGQLYCELNGDRVLISGKALTYLIGNIQLNHPL